jgi:sulfate adenylyltransferase
VTDDAPRWCPPQEDLDDLELLRRGLYGPGASVRPLRLPPEETERALTAGSLVVVDPEGVPVVRVEALEPLHGGLVTGRPAWLADPSPRPFQALHLSAPVDLSDADLHLVESAADVPSSVPPGATLLVLASTTLDGTTTGTDLVRSALAVARPVGGRVLVAPLPEDGERRASLMTTLGLDPSTVPHPVTGPTAVGTRTGSGVVLLLTGLSGSGKSTIARAVATELVEDGTPVTLLDGDRVRRHLTAGLGFSAADRDTNVRRIGWVAAEVAHHGGIAVCSPIAPHDSVRRDVAAMTAARGGRFVLVHVATPLEECERRDRKGLYAAARRGEIPDFTGISAPYDVPADPDLRLDTTGRPVQECVDEVLAVLHRVRG